MLESFSRPKHWIQGSIEQNHAVRPGRLPRTVDSHQFYGTKSMYPDDDIDTGSDDEAGDTVSLGVVSFLSLGNSAVLI